MASPLTGVAADWIGRVTGNPYEGNFYDLVTRTYATATRATPKTQLGPDGIIHDVRAGYLAVAPWSMFHAGARGFAPVIEGARTNYLLNSYGAANTGGVWDGWAVPFAGLGGTATKSIVAGVYGSTAQRIQYTAVAGDAAQAISFIVDNSAVGSFAAAESAMSSMWLKGAFSAGVLELQTIAWDAGGGFLGIVTTGVAVAGTWARFTDQYASLPANTSRCSHRLLWTIAAAGDTIDITIDAVQLEKGTFATSYIPTTSAAVTRDADVLSDFASLTPDADCGFVVRTASLATGAATAVDAITGTVAASLLNRVAQRVVLFPTGRTAGEITALAPILDGYYEYADVKWTSIESER